MSIPQIQRADAWLLAALVFGMLFGFMMGLAAMHQQRNTARRTLLITRKGAINRGYMEVWNDEDRPVYRWEDRPVYRWKDTP
ncbi:hypothetical protein LCGC14_0817270 [marine sediment metagenome]|uniref:Uncharacterized protein n=1 Tax=marine sediment metagenome TaxID=412755 RepID=A0A0F9S4V6_9ZZZZ